jgi:hypothetical protein
MSDEDEIDKTTEILRLSALATRGQKHCVRDYSGEVFELTEDMLVRTPQTDIDPKEEYAAVAECILRKYDKLLSLAK